MASLQDMPDHDGRWIDRLLPRTLGNRIAVAGFSAGLIASLFAATGIGGILMRRAEISESAWLGPTIAATYERTKRMSSDYRLKLLEELQVGNSLRYEWLPQVADFGDSPYIPIPPPYYGGPLISVYNADGPLRKRLLATGHPLPTLEAHLTSLAVSLARHDDPIRLQIRYPDGSLLRISSPKYWRHRTTEVMWAMIMIVGMSLTAALFLLTCQRLSRPYRLLARVTGEQDAASLPRPRGSWTQEAFDLYDLLASERIGRREMLAERTRMLAAISHDLRTPATRLRLRSEKIADDELRDKIHADLDSMLTMIEDAIDFLKGTIVEEKVQKIDFLSLAQSICDDFADVGLPVTLAEPHYPTVETRSTVFGGESELDLKRLLTGNMMGRPEALKRAVSNLVGNAIKYGHQAKVDLLIKPAELVLEITDRGPGIPEDEQDNVMKPFYRLEKSRNRETGGSGLGLSIAYTVAQAHHGKLELINLQRGLLVRLTLPRGLELQENRS